ncbi:MAG: hypothetical protein DSY42_07815 [Aquifex sp.]|nr:MAG: hypothetical protein DSY42_07815 [Aquifex sp.]
MKSIKFLLFSSLILIAGCGGGDDDTNTTAQSQGTITTPEEAKAVVAGFFGALDFGDNVGNSAGNLVTQANRVHGFGFHKRLLNIYGKYVPKGNSLGALQTVQEYTCDESGTYTVEEIGNLSYKITFINCVSLGTTMNGVLVISAVDENNNNIPEEITFTLKQGFSAESVDEAFEAKGDFTLSMKGLNNGDLFDNNQNIRGTLTYQEGPIYFEDRQENKWVEIGFSNFSVALDEVNGTASFSGGITYKDNFCKTSQVSLSFNTIQEFKLSSAECPYAGKLSINNGLITLESHDPDNDPMTENYMRIYFNNTEIFNDVCTNFTPPQSCGGG